MQQSRNSATLWIRRHILCTIISISIFHPSVDGVQAILGYARLLFSTTLHRTEVRVYVFIHHIVLQ